MTRALRAPLAALVGVALCACPSGKDTAPAPSCPGVATPQACPAAVREPVLPPEIVQDLGEVQVGTDVEFVVSAGIASFVIFSQEVGNSAADVVGIQDACPFAIPNAVVPTNVRSPSGTLYYDDRADWPEVTFGDQRYPDVTRVLGYDLGFQAVSGAFQIPSTTAALAATGAQVEPGTWRFTVNDWAWQCPFAACSSGDPSGRYRVHVVTRPVSVDPSHVSTLDVEVYLATDPTSALSTAAGAEAHPDVARWRQSLASFLARGGVTLGRVGFHDVSPEVKERYAPNGTVDVSGDGPCSDLNQLFTTAIVPSRAVHLFLADELVSGPASAGTRVAGVDGSIPGPSGFPGTVYGGAVVGLRDELGFGDCAGAVNLRGCGTDRLAYIAAHEIGHWLGLFHTTERSGTFFDPLSGTDPCPCRSCAPASGPPGSMTRAGCAEVKESPTTLVLNAFCTAGGICGGGRNLMFWLLDDDFSTGELTADQGEIMQLNPAVQ